MWLLSGSTTKFADRPPYESCVVPRGGPPVCSEDPNIDGPLATYSVMRDDFNIKGGGGLRFSWVGFD